MSRELRITVELIDTRSMHVLETEVLIVGIEQDGGPEAGWVGDIETVVEEVLLAEDGGETE